MQWGEEEEARQREADEVEEENGVGARKTLMGHKVGVKEQGKHFPFFTML